MKPHYRRTPERFREPTDSHAIAPTQERVLNRALHRLAQGFDVIAPL